MQTNRSCFLFSFPLSPQRKGPLEQDYLNPILMVLNTCLHLTARRCQSIAYVVNSTTRPTQHLSVLICEALDFVLPFSK